MLELRSVQKRLGSFNMPGLDLHLEPGEYFVLLGPSGAGKTVLLEMVAGLLRPDAGAILWNGSDITASPPEARGFSIVYQDYALFPHLTVAGNIAYGLRARGMRSKTAAIQAAAMAQKLGIDRLLDRYPARLSGGEQQRVALARGLVTNPQMLLLDEPLSALDSGTRRRLQAELAHLHRETQATFLHVTHDLEETVFLADRAAVILDGCVHQVAAPCELLDRPANRQVAEFLGLAATPAPPADTPDAPPGPGIADTLAARRELAYSG